MIDWNSLLLVGLPLGTAAATAWWGRRGERQRWEREQQADRDRHERDERTRRIVRGEDAAKEILSAVAEAQLLATGSGVSEGELQKELRPIHHRIKQQAELLTDDEAQTRISSIADNLIYSNATELNPSLTRSRIVWTCAEAAHQILRAYLHGRPLPATPRMDRLQRLYDEGTDVLSDMYGDDYDPLDEPVRQAPDAPT